MRQAAYATSAAPTYFPPLPLPAPPPLRRYALIDGGVYAQNPALCAYAEAHTIYPGARDFIIASLGTGQTKQPIPYRKAKRAARARSEGPSALRMTSRRRFEGREREEEVKVVRSASETSPPLSRPK